MPALAVPAAPDTSSPEFDIRRRGGPESYKLKPYGFVVLARASAGGFSGKSQHHYIKRFRIAATLTNALDITHAPVFAKYLRARVSDRRDMNEHVLTAIIRL